MENLSEETIPREEIRRQAGLVLRLAEYLRFGFRWRNRMWSESGYNLRATKLDEDLALHQLAEPKVVF